ncbi:phosphoribosyltransferase [Rhizobium oryzicola]|uniref:Phosphoribosyltransferase n=1 Tax=Rhizobium oryzicola TaxID=1232668 RepID=A0ABT8SVZ1_9HYPH|nr:phosphoribosyltransferase [Rhizobium oryzicola]MDO1582470.1 phosphoribosyltransferase [Rhizobium oryzicola]
MGIECIQNEDQTVTVRVTNDHQRDVVTKSPKLPFFEKRDGYFLHSAFVRIGGNREFGSDGNPLVYAIKGLKDFQIDAGSCQLLHEELEANFKTIADRVRTFGPISYIFYTPSASQLSRFLACRFHRIMGVRECLIFDVFEKRSYQDVLADCMRRKTAAKMGSDDRRIISDVINEINRFGKFALKEPFRMKDLPMSLRQYVNPFKLRNTRAIPEGIAGARVVLIEDTIGSGQSSACLAEMLRNAGAREVIVVSAFSPVQPISFVKRAEQVKVEIVRKRRRVRQS